MIGKHESRRKSKGTWTKIRRVKHSQTSSTRNKKSWQKRSGGYRIKHGKHADEQAKGENIETKHRNTLLKRISLLTAALKEMASLQPMDRIKGATRRAMQGLGFLHLRPTFQKLVRQHDRWKALLTVEIGKAESLMEKEN